MGEPPKADPHTHTDRLEDEVVEGGFDYTEARRGTKRLANKYEDGGLPERAAKLRECSRKIWFKRLASGVLRFFYIRHCGDPLCPVCQRAVAQKERFRWFKWALPWLAENHPEARFQTLVLTVPNVSGDRELRQTLEGLHKAFSKLWRWGKRRGSWIGAARYTEVTGDDGRGFHPHVHVLVAVPAEYYDDPSLYLKQSDLAERWAKILGLPEAHVWIEAADRQKGGGGLDPRKVIEAAKYACKGLEVSRQSPEWVCGLRTAISGLRKRQAYGILAEARRDRQELSPEEELEALRSEEEPEGETLGTEDQAEPEVEDQAEDQPELVCFRWDGWNYRRQRIAVVPDELGELVAKRRQQQRQARAGPGPPE